MRDPETPPSRGLDLTRRAFVAGLAAVPAVPLLPAPLAAASVIDAARRSVMFNFMLKSEMRVRMLAVDTFAPGEAASIWAKLDAADRALEAFDRRPENMRASPYGWKPGQTPPLTAEAGEEHRRLRRPIVERRRALCRAHMNTITDDLMAAFARVWRARMQEIRDARPQPHEPRHA